MTFGDTIASMMPIRQNQKGTRQMNSLSRRHGAHVALATALILCSVSTVQAMEWTRQTSFSNAGDVIIFEGKGPVVEDDAERLRAEVVALKNASGKLFDLERAAADNRRPLVSLNSKGGSVAGGIALGSFIRASGFDTIVPAGAECHSACTMAFLGGISRAIIGTFGIHAMSMDENVVKAKGGLADADLYGVQAASSILILYTRGMLGKSDLADVTLRIGLKTTIPVGDTELRDWNVITVASRPQQMYPSSVVTTLDCSADSMKDKLHRVRQLTCRDLTFARNEVRLTEALRALRGSPEIIAIDEEQTRWIVTRNTCEARGNTPRSFSLKTQDSDRWLRDLLQPVLQLGEKSVEKCIEQTYAVRLRELEALVTFYATRNSPASKSWHRDGK